ncbi:MAG: putative transrane cytochrome oxidase [Polaromonas sp.]|jgi:surfeit locus 1 family protein|nr:putative transrane cytochrome oxidase [Polaromonas sp.]MDB5939540.1 putative transrane cytochrome oxidase [Polaromonas sp.]
MTSRLHSRHFWILTLAALLVAAGTFSLGQWQLRRAAQKEAVQAAIDAKNKLSPLDGSSLSATENIADEIHRQAVVQGTWQATHTVYLDNRPMNGRSGFWVFTPLMLQGSGQVILVQRGWAPRDFADRSRLPPVATPAGMVTVQGRIAPPPSKLYAFKGVDAGLIRQNLDLAAFRTETGLPLLEGVSLLQTGSPGEGLLREWAAPNLGVDKHYGYAFQWFGLCLLVVILYVWFQILLPFRASLRAQRSD